MKISAFTFLRNAQKHGYPFIPSIRSLLPIVDEYVIAIGPCEDETEAMVRSIGDPRIRIISTTWNERIRGDYSIKGFVYGQQKSIALFNCTGDWAFYLEGDEVVHEDDLPKIKASMEKYLKDERVEGMIFDYLHFYGNGNTIAWSPAWYRAAPRVLRNTIPAWGPKGLFFTVLDTAKKAHYPRCAHAGGTIHHYGWVKTEQQMNERKRNIATAWNLPPPSKVNYADIDPQVLRPFTGQHPKVMDGWLPPAEGIFQADPNHRLTGRERKHRLMMKLENAFSFHFNKKHYTFVR